MAHPAPRSPSWVRHDLPWAIVLFLIGLFQVMRGTWTDAAIFAAALVLLIVGRATRRQAVLVGRAARHYSAPPLSLLLPVAATLGIVLLLAPRHEPVMGVTLGVVGLVVVAIAWVDRQADAPAPSLRPVRAAASAWVTVIVVAGVWEATAYLVERWGPVAPNAMPAISELADPLLDLPAGKAVFLALWLAAGVVLLRRGWGRR